MALFHEKEPGRYDAAAKLFRTGTTNLRNLNAELVKLGFSPLDRRQLDGLVNSMQFGKRRQRLRPNQA